MTNADGFQRGRSEMWTKRAVRCVALAGAGFALALQSSSIAVARKPRHQVPTTSSRDVERETTGTIPVTKPVVPSPTSPDSEALPPPFHLPTASRKRMRDCGLKWQAMKMSGEAGDNVWRHFATGCLSAAAGPFDKPAER